MNNVKSSIKALPLILKLIIVVLLLAVLALPAFALFTKNSAPKDPVVVKPTLAPFPEKGEYVEEELIVEYEEALTEEHRAQLFESLKTFGVTSEEPLGSEEGASGNFYRLIFSPGVDVEAVSTQIYALPGIKHVESNAIYKLF